MFFYKITDIFARQNWAVVNKTMISVLDQCFHFSCKKHSPFCHWFFFKCLNFFQIFIIVLISNVFRLDNFISKINLLNLQLCSSYIGNLLSSTEILDLKFNVAFWQDNCKIDFQQEPWVLDCRLCIYFIFPRSSEVPKNLT